MRPQTIVKSDPDNRQSDRDIRWKKRCAKRNGIPAVTILCFQT